MENTDGQTLLLTKIWSDNHKYVANILTRNKNKVSIQYSKCNINATQSAGVKMTQKKYCLKFFYKFHFQYANGVNDLP